MHCSNFYHTKCYESKIIKNFKCKSCVYKWYYINNREKQICYCCIAAIKNEEIKIYCECCSSIIHFNCLKWDLSKIYDRPIYFNVILSKIIIYDS